MGDFKVGDKVRVTNHPVLPKGATGTVTGPGDYDYTMRVRFDAPHDHHPVGGWFRSSFEKVEDPSAIKDGDHVRIIIEGPWTGGDAREGVQHDGEAMEYVSNPDDKVTLEKIEPPVVTFKPGDIVRHKNGRDSLRYLVLQDDKFTYVKSSFMSDIGRVFDGGEFTSEFYELVE